ncbi:MAG: hypothetical protein K6B72_05630 [Lachnospiraceae bacterium]|nr:hypothetical protein [Lachnospiraceae bacterium]
MATALANNLLSSLTGSVSKAVLFVRDYDTFKNTAGTPAEADKKAKALEKSLRNLTKGALGGHAGTLDFGSYTNLASSNGYCAMRVQYNPSSIYIETQSGLQEKDNRDASNIVNNQITQINAPTTTTLGMKLIFDDMDVADAFMLDSAPLSVAGIANAVAKKKDIKRTEYTVQKEVEGLIACLISPITRDVIFAWSDMIFRGQLFQVNANYTMFNKRGNPVRAEVEITIQQGKDGESSDKGGYWDTAFTRAFGDESGDKLSGGASSLMQNTNNALLNLSI